MGSSRNASSLKDMEHPIPSTPTKPNLAGPATAGLTSRSWNGPRPPGLNRLPDDPATHPVRYLPGVGPRIGELLAAKGIETASDLIHFFPYRYLDRRRLDPIRTLSPGPKTVVGKVLSAGLLYLGRRRIYEIVLGDDTGAGS